MPLLSKQIIFLIVSLFFQLAYGSPLKSDEDVILFSASARQLDSRYYEVDIHNWVFEKENGSISQRLQLGALAELMENADVSEEQTHSDTFINRISPFLYDSERNKKLTIELNDSAQRFRLNRTDANGHAFTSVSLSSAKPHGSWIDYHIVIPNQPTQTSRDYDGQFQLIPATGLSIISDIDDTIKISEVLDKKALMRHTFVEPFHATEGMPDLYRRFKNKGAFFHYVSSSPWQLYTPLYTFIEEHYPKGSMNLRQFRLKDSSFIDFLKSSLNYKLDSIRTIINNYPKHQFVLIGDSGENDPEIYLQISKEFPDNIKAILIRNVARSNTDETRFKAFDDLPIDHWQLFTTGDDIQ